MEVLKTKSTINQLNINTMKNYLIVSLLCAMSFSFAQDLQYSKGKFYLDGDKIKDKEAKEILTSFEPSLKLYKSAKEKGAIGGLFLGAGLGLVLTDMVLAGYTYKYEYPQSATFIGIGFVAISVPILIGRRKRMLESIRLFNENTNVMKQPTGSHYELNLVNNFDGIGIQLQF